MDTGESVLLLGFIGQSTAMACTPRPLLSTKLTHMSRGWRSGRGTKRRRLCGFRSSQASQMIWSA